MNIPFEARKLPSLNALRAFEAAARHLSFKAAASELNVSQSAISHQIKTLESQLGFSLFARHPRAVKLTMRGQMYYPILREAFDQIAEGTNVMLNKTSQTVMNIQVYSTFTTRWLLPRLNSFQESHENIQIHLHTSQSNTDFQHDSVDLGILIGQANNPSLHYDHLFDSELFPVCSPAYLRKNGPIKLPRNLAQHSLLQVYPSADDWPNWLAAQPDILLKLNPHMQLHMESYNDAFDSAIQGLGIALGQQPFLGRELADGSLVELFPGQRVKNPNRWYLACRIEHQQSPKIEAFRQWILSEIAQDSQIHRAAE
ncbi:MAG: LysR family glycine cleavage system transcriptional activator [Arenicella sp.]|jgi:LysR family glycine cleavage system transcriptional activator